VVGLILAGAVVAAAVTYLPASTSPGTQNTVLRVGYPDSLDESDVSDLYAYNNILPAQGITVVPTFYDAPFLSYQGLAGGQQDIALVSGSSLFAGVSQGEKSTLVSCYSLGGTFLMIAGYGITNLSQLKGGAVDDFGTGSQTRALNLYWLSHAGVPTNTVGLNASSVYLRPSGPNPTRLYDLEHGIGGVKAIAVDDFLLPSVEGANNNTANNGPFRVLAYSPTNVPGVCYAVQDSWLASTSNQAALTKWLAGIIQAQRDFISNPSLMQTYAASQLPLTDPAEIKFASSFYPQHWTYWPYGLLNLQGAYSATNLLANSNTFYLTAGSITSPLANSSGGPFGLFNRNFEKAALQSLGPYTYPCQSWTTPTFAAQVNAVLPSNLGSVPTNCPVVAGPSAVTLPTASLLTITGIVAGRRAES